MFLLFAYKKIFLIDTESTLSIDMIANDKRGIKSKKKLEKINSVYFCIV